MSKIDTDNIYSLIAATSIALNDLDKGFSKKHLYNQLKTLQELSVGLISTTEISELLINGLVEIPKESDPEDVSVSLAFSRRVEEFLPNGRVPLVMPL